MGTAVVGILKKNGGAKTTVFLLRAIPAIIIAFLLTGLLDRVVWNITESVDHRIGFISSDAPVKGDYVNFEFSHPLVLDGEEVRLTKKYICGFGDVIQTKGRDLYCNGEKLATALEYTESGKHLDVFNWNGPIPVGAVFVLGDANESFDSRYWGFVDSKKLNKVNTF